MFAIQSGSKFINARFFIDPDKVFDLTVSANAKVYKTRAEADRVAGLIGEYIDQSIVGYEKHLNGEQAAVAKAKKALTRLEARMAELNEQPYKDVVKKIPTLERQIKEARWTVERNSTAHYRKELNRLERIRSAGIAVVKVQQTVEAL